MKFVVCLEKAGLGKFSNEDVTLGRLCELVEEDAGNAMVRIIDDSDDDYLCPSSWFEPIDLPDLIALRLRDALTRRAA